MPRLGSVLLVACLSAHPAYGQTPPAVLWNQRFSPVTGDAPSQQIETEYRELSAAMRALRAYERTTDRSQALIGLQRAKNAIAERGSDPWSHFVHGALLARGPDLRERPYAEREYYLVGLHSNAATQAVRSLRRALELDHGFSLAAIELAQLALDLNDRDLLRESLRALERVEEPRLRAGAQPQAERRVRADALIMQSRVHLRLREHNEARAAAERARDAGADPSVAAHLATAALFGLGSNRAGMDAYFSGLRSLTATGSDAYHESIVWLLTPRERTQWHSMTIEQRRAFVERLWTERAARAGVDIEERLAAHFQRSAALQGGRLARSAGGPAGQSGGIRPSVYDLFASAGVVMRHGSSERIGRALYCAPGWDTVPPPLQPSVQECQCSSYGRLQSRRLGEPYCGQIRITSWRMTAREQLFEQRLLLRGRDEMDIAAGRQLRGQAVAEAAAGESYYPPYTRHLTMAWQILQFRGKAGTEAVAAVAIPYRSAVDLKSRNGTLDVRITVILADTSSGWSNQSTYSYSRSAAELQEGQFALFHAVMGAAGDRNTAVRVRVENANRSAGRIVYGNVHVDDFGGDTLTISDLVLSPADARGGMTRGSRVIPLAPGRSYTRTEQPALYYEVYGVPEDTPLATRIELEPIPSTIVDRAMASLGRAPARVGIVFHETSDAPDAIAGLQFNRSLGLRSLEAGDYTVRVTVSNVATGKSVQRTTSIAITER